MNYDSIIIGFGKGGKLSRFSCKTKEKRLPNRKSPKCMEELV